MMADVSPNEMPVRKESFIYVSSSLKSQGKDVTRDALRVTRDS